MRRGRRECVLCHRIKRESMQLVVAIVTLFFLILPGASSLTYSFTSNTSIYVTGLSSPTDIEVWGGGGAGTSCLDGNSEQSVGGGGSGSYFSQNVASLNSQETYLITAAIGSGGIAGVTQNYDETVVYSQQGQQSTLYIYDRYGNVVYSATAYGGGSNFLTNDGDYVIGKASTRDLSAGGG